MKKDKSLEKPNEGLNYWLCAGLLFVLLISIQARDITRPFYGLHSWAKASGAWAARCHVKYGLAYTKGLSTWAVGDPPTENPRRYMDHPQLAVLFVAAVMRLVGVSEGSYRLIALTLSLLILFFFLRIVRGLVNNKTALLAGLIYVLFPLSGYFGLGALPTLMGFGAMWCYLVLIGGLKESPEPGVVHQYGLAACLFFAIQFGWHGFFYAFAIGTHYVARCVFRRRMPDKILLAILIFAPLASLALNFTIMAGGYGWDFNKIVELYRWRSAKGEMPEFKWGAWFARLWEFAQMNFTTPILITAILYLTFGQLMVFPRNTSQAPALPSRRFPQFWLFLLIPASQLLILRGALWKHQAWERPLGPLIAIAAALGVMFLTDILKKVRQRLAIIAGLCLIGLFLICCVNGTNYYYAVRWQAPQKVEMFKMLNQNIPPDKALLSFEAFIVDQHKSKGAFYRPEIAWYLDREIVQASSFAEVQQYARTGKYPYYLVPVVGQLSPLTSELRKHYKSEYVPGTPGQRTKDGKFLKAGMYSYMIFDLKSRKAG